MEEEKMSKYIDAEKLTAQIKGIIGAVKAKNHPNEFGSIEQCMAASEIEALGIALDCIKEQQQEQTNEVGGVVHHVLGSHWIETDKKQLTTILKEFPEGAEVELFICAKREEE